MKTNPTPATTQDQQRDRRISPPDRPTGTASYRMFLGLRNQLDDALDNVVDPDTRRWIEGEIIKLDQLLGHAA